MIKCTITHTYLSLSYVQHTHSGLQERVQFPIHSHSDTGSARIYFVTPSTVPSASATIYASISSCYTHPQ